MRRAHCGAGLTSIAPRRPFRSSSKFAPVSVRRLVRCRIVCSVVTCIRSTWRVRQSPEPLSGHRRRRPVYFFYAACRRRRLDNWSSSLHIGSLLLWGCSATHLRAKESLDRCHEHDDVPMMLGSQVGAGGAVRHSPASQGYLIVLCTLLVALLAYASQDMVALLFAARLVIATGSCALARHRTGSQELSSACRTGRWRSFFRCTSGRCDQRTSPYCWRSVCDRRRERAYTTIGRRLECECSD